MEETINKICEFINTLITLLEKELNLLANQEQESTITAQNKIITILQKLVNLVFKLQTVKAIPEEEIFNESDQLILDHFIKRITKEAQDEAKK